MSVLVPVCSTFRLQSDFGKHLKKPAHCVGCKGAGCFEGKGLSKGHWVSDPYSGKSILVLSECMSHPGCPASKDGKKSLQWQGDDPRWLAQFPAFVQQQYNVILTGKFGVTETGLKLYGLQVSEGTPASQLQMLFREAQRNVYCTAILSYLEYRKYYNSRFLKGAWSSQEGLGQAPLLLPRLEHPAKDKTKNKTGDKAEDKPLVFGKAMYEWGA